MKNKLIIPLSPLPPSIMLALASNFLGIGQLISSIFPYLALELKQAEIDLEPEEYCAIIFVECVFYFLAAAILTYFFAMRFMPENTLMLSLTAGALLSFALFMQLSFYPKLKVTKKVRGIEQNLMFAIRTFLIEVKSGVSLFNVMKQISIGDYGEISKEFHKTVEKIESGTIETDAIEEMASNNPSLYFRRTIWQLVNGLKAGADISTVLTALTDSLTKEQKNQIKKYGSQMKLLSLMYMMLGVIIPALGFTFLIVLGSFPQIELNEEIFWLLLGSIAFAQFMYLGILKSRRPNLLEG
ncbi:MAG: type II secretion system F family protein [Candidatus Diapherotrites archaeon]